MAVKKRARGRAVAERAAEATVVNLDRFDVRPRLEIRRALQLPHAIVGIGDGDVRGVRGGGGRDGRGCLGKGGRRDANKRDGEDGGFHVSHGEVEGRSYIHSNAAAIAVCSEKLRAGVLRKRRAQWQCRALRMTREPRRTKSNIRP